MGYIGTAIRIHSFIPKKHADRARRKNGHLAFLSCLVQEVRLLEQVLGRWEPVYLCVTTGDPCPHSQLSMKESCRGFLWDPNALFLEMLEGLGFGIGLCRNCRDCGGMTKQAHQSF